MKIKTLDELIETEVKYWIGFLSNKNSHLFMPGYEKELSLARAIEALPEKTPEAVNAARVAHGWTPIFITCSNCGKELNKVVMLYEGDEWDTQLCPDCLRAALAMYEQVENEKAL